MLVQTLATPVRTTIICVMMVVLEVSGQPNLSTPELRRTEATIRRFAASTRVDQRAIEAAARAFQGDGPWEREQAIARVATEMTRGTFDIVGHNRLRLQAGTAVQGQPAIAPLKAPKSKLSYSARAAEFVDLVAARTRLDTVLEELRGKDVKRRHRSALLTRNRSTTLLQSLGVRDATMVSDSFDWRHPVIARKLEEDTVVWRLSGGDSPLLGRYFVCCNWISSSGAHSLRWFDASGLALPPGNSVDHLIAATISADTQVIVGAVADNFANRVGGPVRGGNTQIFIPAPAPLDIESFKPAGDATTLDSIAPVLPGEVQVWRNLRLLRFRLSR